MTDKEKIREEVERLFNDIKDSNFESDSGAFYYLKDLLDYIDSLQEEPVSIWHDAKISVPEDSSLDILCIEEGGYARIGKGKVLSGTTKWSYVNDLLNLTNTVTKISEQEEPVSVGLEEAVKNRDEYKEWQGSPDIQKELIDFAKFGNQYKEPVSEGLEKAAEKIMPSKYCWSGDGSTTLYTKEQMKEFFKAGAKWQKQQDQSTIELAEDHAMLAGMNKMEEQIMSKAKSGIGAKDNYIKFEDDTWLDLDPTMKLKPAFDVKEGEKVKVLIIKEV